MLSDHAAPPPDPPDLLRGLTYDYGLLRDATPEPVYALPARLLDALARLIPDWFEPDELEQERALTALCTGFHAVAAWQGRFVQHSVFWRSDMPPVSDGQMHTLHQHGWPEAGTAADVRAALVQAQALLAPLHEQSEAYLGWLLTDPAFRAERDALRTQWQDVTGQMEELPRHAVERHLALRPPPASPEVAAAVAADFQAFFDRWHLSGLATWDLPEPRLGIVGVPGLAGTLAGVDQYPAIQLSPAIRLPARYPVQALLHGALGPHLEGWQAVQEQRHPSGFNYQRWRRLLHLHVLRNVMLAGRYRGRFRRRTGRLDEVFADYFGDRNEETVRKLRQWIDRHGPPAADPPAADPPPQR